MESGIFRAKIEHATKNSIMFFLQQLEKNGIFSYTLIGYLLEISYIQQQQEENRMKAKSGFVLRNVVDEYILMPTGDNIGKFNGTVLLNEVSAFVWEKLQNPISRDDLLKAILDEFEVEKAVASADLDALLKTLKQYDVIEDD